LWLRGRKPTSGELTRGTAARALVGVVIAAFGVRSVGVFEHILHPVMGALIGGFCGWLFGRTLRFVFVTLPRTAIDAFRKDRSKNK
jgi:hypothetical protein